METVGAFEAKTHFSQLLDRAAAGETIAVTRHGKRVARIIPEPLESEASDALEKIKAIRSRVKATSVDELVDWVREARDS